MNKVCFDGLAPPRTAPRRRAPALSCTRLVRPLLPRARNAHRRAAALCAQRQKTEAGPSSESPGGISSRVTNTRYSYMVQ